MEYALKWFFAEIVPIPNKLKFANLYQIFATLIFFSSTYFRAYDNLRWSNSVGEPVFEYKMESTF